MPVSPPGHGGVTRSASDMRRSGSFGRLSRIDGRSPTHSPDARDVTGRIRPRPPVGLTYAIHSPPVYRSWEVSFDTADRVLCFSSYWIDDDYDLWRAFDHEIRIEWSLGAPSMDGHRVEHRERWVPELLKLPALRALYTPRRAAQMKAAATSAVPDSQLTLALACTLDGNMPEAELRVHIVVDGISLLQSACRLERARLAESPTIVPDGPFGGVAYFDRLPDVFAGTSASDLEDFDGHVGLLACGCLSVSCGVPAARRRSGRARRSAARLRAPRGRRPHPHACMGPHRD